MLVYDNHSELFQSKRIMLDMVPVLLSRVVTLLGLPVRRVEACHCLVAHLR